MKHYFQTAFVAAAGALAMSAPAAQASLLINAYSMENGEFGLSYHDTSSVAEIGFDSINPATRGLAYGDAGPVGGFYYVSMEDPTQGAVVARYDIGGNHIGSLFFGPVLEAGPLAYGGDTLFWAYETVFAGSGHHVGWLDPNFGVGSVEIDIGGKATGLAFGDDSLFVAWDSTIARYDLGGNLLGSHDFGSGIELGPLAFGAGQLFAGYTSGGSSYGYASVDPLTFFAGGANVATASKVNGLAFGDGGVFASFDHSLAKYDLGGAELATYDTGRRINGPLAFLPDATPGAAPEPSAWALMILGFGVSGAAFRRRRRMSAAGAGV